MEQSSKISRKILSLVNDRNRAAYDAAIDKAVLVQELLTGADINARINGPRCRYLEDMLATD